MMPVLLTLLATTAMYVALAAWGLRRIVRHLQGNPEAVQAVTEHVLVPLLGRKKPEADAIKPVPRDARLC